MAVVDKKAKAELLDALRRGVEKPEEFTKYVKKHVCTHDDISFQILILSAGKSSSEALWVAKRTQVHFAPSFSPSLISPSYDIFGDASFSKLTLF
jgi:hypothetical protein